MDTIHGKIEQMRECSQNAGYIDMRRILGPKMLGDLKLTPSYTNGFNEQINKRNKCVTINIV